jgi:serine/threonine protein kinase
MSGNFTEVEYSGFDPLGDCLADLTDESMTERWNGNIINSPKNKYHILKSLFEYLAEITIAGFILNDISIKNIAFCGQPPKGVIKLTPKMASLSTSASWVVPTRAPVHPQNDNPLFRAPETYVLSKVERTKSDDLFHVYSVKSEIWSLGMVFLYLLAGGTLDMFSLDNISKPWLPEASIDFINHLKKYHPDALSEETLKNIVASENMRWQIYSSLGSSDPKISPVAKEHMRKRRRYFLQSILMRHHGKTFLTQDTPRYVRLLSGMLDPDPTSRSTLNEIAKFFQTDLEVFRRKYVTTVRAATPLKQYTALGGWTIDKEDALNRALKATFEVYYAHADDEIKTVAALSGIQMASAFYPDEQPACLYATVLSAVAITASLYDRFAFGKASVKEIADGYYSGIVEIPQMSNELDHAVRNFFINVLKVPFKRVPPVGQPDEKLIQTDGSAFELRKQFTGGL